MYKILIGIAAYVALIAPFSVSAEVIRSFISDIEVREDGTFLVTETIEYDFENADRHGIFRYIDTGHPDPSSSFLKDRYLDLKIGTVTMDGTVVPYEVEREWNQVFLRIGDANRTITGLHTYLITYTVSGGLVYYDNGIDLYWNATGNEWEVPMESVTVRVHGEEGILEEERSCYVGESGATESCTVSGVPSAAVFTASDVAPGEEVTVAVALNPEVVETLILEKTNLVIPWIVFGVLWFIGLFVFLYRYATAHKKQHTIIAQYEPYDDLKPMYTGVVFDGRLDSQDITAGIVYLAEQGFFKIKHTDRKAFFIFEVDDYEITLLRSYTDLKSELQKKIFTLLFKENALPGETISLSELSKNTGKQTENFKTLQALRKAASEDLKTDGYFESTTKNIWKAFLVMGSILMVSVIGTLFFSLGVGLLLVPVAIILFVSFIAIAIVYRRRTQKGYEAQNHLKGFKLFLSVTDKERFAFHNAPEKSPEQFMEYLPYAIAFGVEKKWAEVFKDITIPEPDWYDGGGHGAFSAIHLSNSLGAFGTTFSSSSGTSASSGGGSAGGGAGGGGGGSW